jgi:hypothetical protein
MGIGAIPNATLQALTNHEVRGVPSSSIHVGAEAGSPYGDVQRRIIGSHRTWRREWVRCLLREYLSPFREEKLWGKSKVVSSFTMGSKKLYEARW